MAKWQSKDKASKDWLDKFSDLHPLIVQLLYNRGLSDQNEVDVFLGRRAEAHYDPFLFRHMQEAADMVIKHIKAGQKIAICGDYDADGVTSSAVLYEVLSRLKAKVEVWIPSRQKDGYGLNDRMVKDIAKAGCKLIITVDNGVRNAKQAKLARELGLDIVVTDHHTAPEDKKDQPEGPLLNPVLEEEKYPFKYLAGVGVAYKLAEALIALSTLDKDKKEKVLAKVSDLVAVGTVADCVSVLGENRTLIKTGLKRLNYRPRLGLKQIMKEAGTRPPVAEWQIGWQIAPRLNVAGRLNHANPAFRLMITTDRQEASELSAYLNEQNIKRQEETAAIVEECIRQVEEHLSQDNILVLTSPDLQGGRDKWHEGVIGLVAGRITERYHKPSLVICQSGGKIKGSGRSVDDYSIISAVNRAGKYLTKWGGHKAACGFSVKDKDNLELFAQEIRAIGRQELSAEDLQPRVTVEAELPLTELDEELLNQILAFAPFGMNNPEPGFLAKDEVIMDKMEMGAEKTHVKFKVNGKWALAFNQAKRWKNFNIGDRIDLVYTAEFNEFNGKKNVQLKIIDMKKANG